MAVRSLDTNKNPFRSHENDEELVGAEILYLSAVSAEISYLIVIEVLNKAREELDRVISRERWVEEKDCTQLPYIESILNETFRLHPLGTILAPHYSTQDCNVAGYDIPKGTTIWVNLWSIGRDPRNWEFPDEFIPERFMGKDFDISGQNFNLLPFGSGRRRCPAYSLGVKIGKSTLANLIHGLNWKLPKIMKPEDVNMEEHFGLTTHPKFPLNVIVEPRLASHLYK
ncbi:trimethyltridecatetraene synthase-like [Solanum dulcamara]|uniref:trimethyltridecatetraene synthase-like n=1 Tax=Solanum dulcamara TaxID=45834 RepID=UPI002486B039|nr:trimethyltridecatetraene synthase-like [Solanum dulcamara]